MHNERLSEQAARDERLDPATSTPGSPPLRPTDPVTAIDDGSRQFQLLVGAVRDYAIYMLDPNGIVVSWNAGAERIKGYSEREIVGQSFAKFYTEADQRDGAPARSLRTAREQGRFEAEAQRVRKDGSLFWANVVVEPIRNESGRLIGFAKITRDITERRRGEERLRELAHMDALTGLPNRATLTAKFDELIAEAIPVAVLMLDLDGFKDTNDSFGHAAGDATLRLAGSRIQSCVGDHGIVARWGGDEFAALLPGVADSAVAAEIARELITAFEQPFLWDEHEIQLGLSIGIAFALNAGVKEETLTDADLALYRAKAEGRNRLSFYETKLREESVARKTLECELRLAAERNEFEVFYQPQVSLTDGRTVGAEALLRWNHPERGLLAPGAFLQVLAESTKACAVGDWIIREACAFAARVRDELSPEFKMAVNVFGAQFRRGRFVSAILEGLRAHQLPPHALTVEITEDIILRHESAIVQPLQMLHSLGIGIAFDDYGTGYASLSLLKRYPLTTLKVDKGFVRNMCDDRQDESVVKAISYLGRSFGLDVVAEGVETQQQVEALQRLDCATAQGFLFGRPMPAGEFMDWLAERSRRQGTEPALRNQA